MSFFNVFIIFTYVVKGRSLIQNYSKERDRPEWDNKQDANNKE